MFSHKFSADITVPCLPLGAIMWNKSSSGGKKLKTLMQKYVSFLDTDAKKHQSQVDKNTHRGTVRKIS